MEAEKKGDSSQEKRIEKTAGFDIIEGIMEGGAP
jgi:hypothetical protein